MTTGSTPANSRDGLRAVPNRESLAPAPCGRSAQPSASICWNRVASAALGSRPQTES